MAHPVLQSVNHSASINGFDLVAVEETVKVLGTEPARALTEFRVHSSWAGAAAAEHRVDSYELGGERIARQHVFRSDEPIEFFGANSAPNPQEYLFAALNACMLFGYATKAAVMGIPIERMTIDTRGRMDVRGTMGLAPVPPGCETLACTVHIKARGTQEQLEALHQEVLRSSPNVYHVMSAIRLAPTLVVD
jgi:uncharacterized OsmC-like protein